MLITAEEREDAHLFGALFCNSVFKYNIRSKELLSNSIYIYFTVKHLVTPFETTRGNLSRLFRSFAFLSLSYPPRSGAMLLRREAYTLDSPLYTSNHVTGFPQVHYSECASPFSRASQLKDLPESALSLQRFILYNIN